MSVSVSTKSIALIFCCASQVVWAWNSLPPEPSSQNALLSPVSLLAAPSNRISKFGAEGPEPRSGYAPCHFNEFASESGSALVRHVRSVEPGCLYDLFESSEITRAALSHANMMTVIRAARKAVASYDGTASAGMEQLLLFIRAGYFLASKERVPAYPSSHQTLIKAFINEFERNHHFYRNRSKTHDRIRYEFLVLLTNTHEEARGLPIAKKVIDKFNKTKEKNARHITSVNGALILISYGPKNEAYIHAVNKDISIVDSLYLILRDAAWLVEGDSEHIYNRAATEFGRFLSIPSTQARVKSLLDSILPVIVQNPDAWFNLMVQVNQHTTN